MTILARTVRKLIKSVPISLTDPEGHDNIILARRTEWSTQKAQKSR